MPFMYFSRRLEAHPIRNGIPGIADVSGSAAAGSCENHFHGCLRRLSFFRPAGPIHLNQRTPPAL